MSQTECITRAELNLHLDSELSIEVALTIEQHLSACPACRAERDALHLVRQTVAGLPRPAPREAIRIRLLAEVTADMDAWRIEARSTERRRPGCLERRKAWHGRFPAPLLPAGSPPSAAGLQRKTRRTQSGRLEFFERIETR